MAVDLTQAELEPHFAALAESWHEATDDLASVSRVVSHPAYLEIIEMGSPAVAFVLSDLRKNGGQWFSALEAITACKVGTPEERTNYGLLRQAWLTWGSQRGLA